MTTAMIYMKVTMGGVWVLEQKTKQMKMSVLWQILKDDDKESKEEEEENRKKMMMKLKLLMS